ncbi:MAG: hypothetical protein PHQ23_16175, partial [Candidatus Wallbacteria bacterium]|nr:hypothetical protein [Candidatus Wallbacteria bacterium]
MMESRRFLILSRIFPLLAAALLLVALSGCGAGGASGGDASITDLSTILGIRTVNMINLGVVISGKSSVFSAPSPVFVQNNLILELAWIENGTEQVMQFPSVGYNCFRISGLERKSEHYIVRIKLNNSLYADFPLNLEDYTATPDLILLHEVTVDQPDGKITVLQVHEIHPGTAPMYCRILFERPIIEKSSALDFNAVNLGRYDELLLRNVFSYFEETEFDTWDMPGDFFEEMVLEKHHENDNYPISEDADANGLDDPFYTDRGEISSRMDFPYQNLRADSVLVLIGEIRGQDMDPISINNDFYATLMFYAPDGARVVPLDFGLRITAESGGNKVLKESFFTKGSAYRIDGFLIDNITLELQSYYLHYSKLSDMAAINVAT